MKNIPGLVLCTFLFLIGCSDTKSKQKAESKGELSYSIDAPEGWTKQSIPAMGQDATVLASPVEENDNFRENINVLTESTKGMDREAYLSKSVSILESQLTELVMLKQSDREINGMNFDYMRYTHKYNGTPIETETYCLVKNGTAYIITCSAWGGTIDSKWAPLFDEAIRSFRLN